MASIDLLANFTLDAYLLAKSSSSELMPDGRKWERAIGELLWRPGLPRRQYAGTLSVFGMTSASGCNHELDAVGDGWETCLLLEAKAKESGVDKTDLAVFHVKTLDYYLGNTKAAKQCNWWRVLVSATEVRRNVCQLAAYLGIILCDPTRLPLPVLVRAAGKPAADQYFNETLIQEMTRLGEPAIWPMQQRWLIDGDEVRFKANLLDSGDLRDLVWVQQELTLDFLDLYDLYLPGALETRASSLVNRLESLTYA